MKQYKVRFHLAQGENYMQWQVRVRDSDVQHYDPARYSLVMTNCVLRNHKATAQRIHDGDNKEVCAWIACDSVDIIELRKRAVSHTGDPICYNPKKLPYWTDVSGQQNLDGTRYERLATDGRQVIHTQF
jgi:hypothetical protein